MGKRSNSNPSIVLDIPVEFGGVSIGQTTARLGVKINRTVCNIVAADETFCGHRLTGEVVLGQNGDQGGQRTLVDDLHHRVKGSFDAKRIGISPDVITTGLTFSLKDVDISELAKFSKGAGRLTIEGVAEIPEDAPDEHEEEEGPAVSPPGSLKAEGPWRDVQLDLLFSGGLLKNLKVAGLATVGDLANYTASDKRLTDIKGVGEAAVQKIEDRMLEFFRDNNKDE